MIIQNISKWKLLEESGATNNQNVKQMKDAVPELKSRQIKTDSVDFSEEGTAAMRKQVQSMPGHIDVEEIMQMREILPKLRMNPSDNFQWAMQDDMQNSLNALKQSKGGYTLEDLITIRMDAYSRQYDALKQSYADGSRDIYVSDGIDENGKLQYHKVTEEEDFAYLNEAFDRVADSLMFSAKSQEIQWQINENFGGQKMNSIPLPAEYGEKLSGILKRAASAYAEQTGNGKEGNAANLALKYLNEDTGFADAMRVLFSNI